MAFMNTMQMAVLWVIIFGFIGIVGYELFNRAKKYKAIQDAKHRKLLKKLQEEE